VPIRVIIPNGITIGSASVVGLTVVTDRQMDRSTDRPLYSVCSNRPHLARTFEDCAITRVCEVHFLPGKLHKHRTFVFTVFEKDTPTFST